MTSSSLFADDRVRLDLLRERAYNQRWAMVPPDVIPLTAADPDFAVAPEIIEAIQEYTGGGVLSYGPKEGLPEFKKAVARVVMERKGIVCTPDLILPTDSAAAAMFLIARYACHPGDEAIIFDPVDFLFGQSVVAAGGRCVYSKVDKKTGAFDLDGLRDLITPRTRMIGLCNPHNPLGRVMTEQELRTIGELAVEHDLLIMADEIWSDIVYPPHQHRSMASLSPEIAERTVTVFGFSKMFGLAGLRIGFLVAPNPQVYEALVRASWMRTTATGVTTISQVAARTAYESCWYWVDAFVEHLHRVRDYAVDRLNRMEGITCHRPQGTYLLFPDIGGLGLSSQEVADYLLETARVAVVPGLPRWFGPGAGGNIRICFSTSFGIISKALDRIDEALRSRG
ncbi:MAG: pyridoxal phosphate-dependent aminotransferase [Anaerolineae bacterium]